MRCLPVYGRSVTDGGAVMGQEIKIESGIPIPPKGNDTTALAKEREALLSLEVGQSFAVSCDAQTRNSLRALVSNTAKKTGRKFATRQMPDEGPEVIRVWRFS